MHFDGFELIQPSADIFPLVSFPFLSFLYFVAIFVRYSHGAEPRSEYNARYCHTRPILPTERIFQGSITGGSACRLPVEWTSCKSNSSKLGGHYRNSFCTLRLDDNERTDTHNFDEVTLPIDSHTFDMDSQASIYHFMLWNTALKASEESLRGASLYTARYGQAVLDDLDSRGLRLIVEVGSSEKDMGMSDPAADEWVSLFDSKEVIEKTSFLPAEASYNFHLPNNFSTRSSLIQVTLPNFAIDYSEYLIGAIIERVADSFDLYATMFFLSHSILRSRDGDMEQRVNAEVYDIWKRAINSFESAEYSVSGIRAKSTVFYCRISNNGTAPFYLVEGEFVPNKMSIDVNSNKKLDILRCKMADTERAYLELARTRAEMHVEILRKSTTLMKFRIPWIDRKTGFMLSEPEGQSFTKFDPWKGFNRSSPGEWTTDNIYLCASGWSDLPSKSNLPSFLEFIQHHLLLGVDHIFTGLVMGWDSKHMKTAKNILSSFIDDRLLSITSQSGDGVDGCYR